MREIKFRAWDRLFKEMFVVGALSGSAVWHTQHPSKKQSGIPLNNIELMQYTGLLDKQGKEIYEGDIVEQHHNKEYALVFVVKWNQDRCGFWMYLHNKPHLDLGSFREELEVIGDIYGNPELLKEVEK